MVQNDPCLVVLLGPFWPVFACAPPLKNAGVFFFFPSRAGFRATHSPQTFAVTDVRIRCGACFCLLRLHRPVMLYPEGRRVVSVSSSRIWTSVRCCCHLEHDRWRSCSRGCGPACEASGPHSRLSIAMSDRPYIQCATKRAMSNHGCRHSPLIKRVKWSWPGISSKLRRLAVSRRASHLQCR
jgi:hypothetical protein